MLNFFIGIAFFEAGAFFGFFVAALMQAARSGGTGYVSLKDVAARQEISVKYLEQIAGSLSKAGMLRSSRGSQGGYQLTRPPEAYSLGDILRRRGRGDA